MVERAHDLKFLGSNPVKTGTLDGSGVKTTQVLLTHHACSSEMLQMIAKTNLILGSKKIKIKTLS